MFNCSPSRSVFSLPLLFLNFHVLQRSGLTLSFSRLSFVNISPIINKFCLLDHALFVSLHQSLSCCFSLLFPSLISSIFIFESFSHISLFLFLFISFIFHLYFSFPLFSSFLSLPLFPPPSPTFSSSFKHFL